jgi:hypothetical protein
LQSEHREDQLLPQSGFEPSWRDKRTAMSTGSLISKDERMKRENKEFCKAKIDFTNVKKKKKKNQ